MIRQTIAIQQFWLLTAEEQQTVTAFIEFLLNKPQMPRAIARAANAPRQLGTLRGEIWMAKDFNEPLEDLKEYLA